MQDSLCKPGHCLSSSYFIRFLHYLVSWTRYSLLTPFITSFPNNAVSPCSITPTLLVPNHVTNFPVSDFYKCFIITLQTFTVKMETAKYAATMKHLQHSMHLFPWKLKSHNIYTIEWFRRYFMKPCIQRQYTGMIKQKMFSRWAIGKYEGWNKCTYKKKKGQMAQTRQCYVLFMSMGWDYVSRMWPPIGLLCIPNDIWVCWAMVKWYSWRKTEKVRREICLSATLSTTNPTWTDELTRMWTEVSTVGGRQLTVWAMAWPSSVLLDSNF
jgi:hypothetical protein